MESCPRSGMTDLRKRLLSGTAPAYMTKIKSAPASPPCKKTFARVSAAPVHVLESPLNTQATTSREASTLSK